MNTTTNNPHATVYSAEWTGQDGRQWREMRVWCNPGFRTFLQVMTNGEWMGY